MDSEGAAALFVSAMAPSPKSAHWASSIKSPISSPTSPSLPIRAPPSSDDDFDVEKLSDAASFFGETGSDYEFNDDTASEKLSEAGADEVCLELEARMPIAQLSVDDEGDDVLVDAVSEFCVESDGDMFTAVVRVPPQVLEGDLSGCSARFFSENRIGAFTEEERENTQGDFSPSYFEALEKPVGENEDGILNSGSAENPGDFDARDEGKSLAERSLAENPLGNVSDLIETETLAVQEPSERQSTGTKGFLINQDFPSEVVEQLSSSGLQETGFGVEDFAVAGIGSEERDLNTEIKQGDDAISDSSSRDEIVTVDNSESTPDASTAMNPGGDQSNPLLVGFEKEINELLNSNLSSEDCGIPLMESATENFAILGDGSAEGSQIDAEAAEPETPREPPSVNFDGGTNALVISNPPCEENKTPVTKPATEIFALLDDESAQGPHFDAETDAESEVTQLHDPDFSQKPEYEVEAVAEDCHSFPAEAVSQISVSDPDLVRLGNGSQFIKFHSESGNAEDGDLDNGGYVYSPVSGSSNTAEQSPEHCSGSSSSQSGPERSSAECSQKIQPVMTDLEEVEASDGKKISVSTAQLKVAHNSADAALSPQLVSLEPSHLGKNKCDVIDGSEFPAVGESTVAASEEERKILNMIHAIKVKFLRLVHRLGHSPNDSVVGHVLYRLGMGTWSGRLANSHLGFDRAMEEALEMEMARKDDLDFSCNILVLGKTGVGKSATINSVFEEERTPVSAFAPSTDMAKEIVGTVDGIKIKFIDTPGLGSSAADQSSNRKTMMLIKEEAEKCPPDVVLYVDRLDEQNRDCGDLPLQRCISSTLGSTIWLKTIITLTHAASAPPEGSHGAQLSYDASVMQRSRIVQQSIWLAAGNTLLISPITLVENHPSCRRNQEGQQVLPNGKKWRSELLLLCYSLKIMSEVNSLLKVQESTARKLFASSSGRSPLLPYFLSSLLQPRVHPKLSTSMDMDIDLEDLSDSECEGSSEYDHLPPFRPLKKSQIAKLSKDQRRAFEDEYRYRIKLLEKKQWTALLRRTDEMKQGQGDLGHGDMGDEKHDQEDMALPLTFDGDDPSYRYRIFQPKWKLLVKPAMDSQGCWDHDYGYNGIAVEDSLAIAGRFPASIAGQIVKGKGEFNIHLDSSISVKRGENCSTMAGFSIQNAGQQLAYTLRGETKTKTFKKNRAAAGVSAAFLGEKVVAGIKVEDQVFISRQLTLAACGGGVRNSGDDAAYGANLELRCRDRDFPVEQKQSSLGLSLMKCTGDLVMVACLQSDFSVGRSSKATVRIELNNKSTGKISIRAGSSEQIQIGLMGIIPLLVAAFRAIWGGESNRSR